MKQGIPLLALAIAVPTALLGVGWLLSSQREHAAYARESQQRLMRAADAVRAAVDESLEELRQREDRRPFYLYNHFYSPPESEVKSVTDPVAVSPLARAPDDPRVVGFFQVDPDGQVRSPMLRNPGDPAPPRAERVLVTLQSDAFTPLRELRQASEEDSLLAALPPAPRPDPPRTRPFVEPEPDDLEPQGPLTVSLNQWGNTVFDEIEAAQQGDALANLRVQQRGRRAPQTRRNAISWNEFGQPESTQQAPLSQAMPQEQPQAERVTQAPQPVPQAQAPRAPQAERVQQRRRRRRRRRPAPPPEPDLPVCAPGTEDPFACVPEPSALVSQREADVGYTTMAWRRVGDEVLLHRLVDHEGAVVVQGALLDRPHLKDVWIPALIGRLGDAVVGRETLAPTLVERTDDAACALREPASEVLSLDLCFPEARVAAILGAERREGRTQLALLIGLLAIVGFAVVLIVRAARRAEELSRQKSDFVSAVSHELRTPLTTIRMHSEMLQEGMVPEPRQPKVFGELVQESVRLGRLVENVLELSRLEEGRRPLRTSERDLRAHLRELLESQRPLVERRGFRLVLPEPGDPLHLAYDGQAIEQITLNLVDNALKYGGGDEEVVEVHVGREDAGAFIEVRDRGPGIPPAERERVFERFHRVEREATKHMPGTGIGLALVRELTRAHGGDVTIAGDGGCTIRVSLPG